MEIKVVHEIRFSKEAEGLVALVAQALTGALTNNTVAAEPTSSVTEAPKQEEKQANVATKTMYFQHEGSGELVVVEKGESLDFLEGDIFDELTVAQYNNLKLDAEKAQEEAEKSEPAQEEFQTEDEPSHNLTVEDLRVIASKFVGAGKQKELKVLFGEFSDAEGKKAIKLSGIQVKDYPAFMERAKEVLTELGVE